MNGTPIPPWLEVAFREMGVAELAGRADNPRIVEYHQATTLRATDDEVPWCSSFACWCLEQAGFESTRSARARSHLFWGTPLNPPPYGAIVVISRGRGPQPGPEVLEAPGHVGFYLGRASAQEILIYGGNQGNAVQVRAYAASRVLGYRWPMQL